MLGPGEYVGDVTEGITRVEDLLKAQIVQRSRNFRRLPCPQCGCSAHRVRCLRRQLRDLGDRISERRREIQLTYSQHHCHGCGAYFSAPVVDLASARGHYTLRVVLLAVRLVVEDGLPYRTASWHLWRDHRVFVPFATVQNWVEAGGKRATQHLELDYLDPALSQFSGYFAAEIRRFPGGRGGRDSSLLPR